MAVLIKHDGKILKITSDLGYFKPNDLVKIVDSDVLKFLDSEYFIVVCHDKQNEYNSILKKVFNKNDFASVFFNNDLYGNVFIIPYTELPKDIGLKDYLVIENFDELMIENISNLFNKNNKTVVQYNKDISKVLLDGINNEFSDFVSVVKDVLIDMYNNNSFLSKKEWVLYENQMFKLVVRDEKNKLLLLDDILNFLVQIEDYEDAEKIKYIKDFYNYKQ